MPQHFVPQGVFQKAVIFNRDKVLVLRQSSRGGNIKREQWDLPGGRLDTKESPEDALKREIREETGIRIGKYLLIASSLEKFHDNKIRLGLIYLAETDKQKVRVNRKEHAGFEWLEAKEIKKKKFAFPNTPEWIEKALQFRRLIGRLHAVPRKHRAEEPSNQ